MNIGSFHLNKRIALFCIDYWFRLWIILICYFKFQMIMFCIFVRLYEEQSIHDITLMYIDIPQPYWYMGFLLDIKLGG